MVFDRLRGILKLSPEKEKKHGSNNDTSLEYFAKLYAYLSIRMEIN